MQIDMIYME